jgi:hypothetical protein
MSSRLLEKQSGERSLVFTTARANKAIGCTAHRDVSIVRLKEFQPGFYTTATDWPGYLSYQISDSLRGRQGIWGVF